jgi:hypothetical protein
MHWLVVSERERETQDTSVEDDHGLSHGERECIGRERDCFLSCEGEDLHRQSMEMKRERERKKERERERERQRETERERERKRERERERERVHQFKLIE